MPPSSAKRRYSKEELASRGDAIYETLIRPQLTSADHGKFAAIDIETGLFEVNEAELKACDLLRARVADAQVWLVKVGSPYVHRFGGRSWRGIA